MTFLVRTIPLGPGGWPKRAFFHRPGDELPTYIFTRNGPTKNWKGHGVYFMSLARVKKWVENQETKP